MTTKKCCICKEEKILEEFNKNSYKKDGLQSACKSCNKDRSKAYYKNRTDHHRAVVKIQKLTIRKRNTQYVWDYLLQHPCIDCGATNPVVLEFDHVRGKKIADLAVLMQRVSIEKIDEEISKCEVRCANCHRIKTASQLGWYKHIDTGSIAQR